MVRINVSAESPVLTSPEDAGSVTVAPCCLLDVDPTVWFSKAVQAMRASMSRSEEPQTHVLGDERDLSSKLRYGPQVSADAIRFET